MAWSATNGSGILENPGCLSQRDTLRTQGSYLLPSFVWSSTLRLECLHSSFTEGRTMQLQILTIIIGGGKGCGLGHLYNWRFLKIMVALRCISCKGWSTCTHSLNATEDLINSEIMSSFKFHWETEKAASDSPLSLVVERVADWGTFIMSVNELIM